MKKKPHKPFVFHDIPTMNRALGLPAPVHPLIVVNDYRDITADVSEISKGMIMDFYKISYKKVASGKIRYGQGMYDFSNGGLSFIAPNQLIAEVEEASECQSTTLLIHPDFFQGYAIAKNIRNYGFFSYNANEALQLTDSERTMILNVFGNIQDELSQRLDRFSQDVIISQIELLLNYSNRFYSRQFITQKHIHNELLDRLELLLNKYFEQNEGLNKGLPTVQWVASELNVSPGYLGDILRANTGLNTQQHLHLKVIEKAKEFLTNDTLTVAEIAYHLGFERPQSFNKLFRSKVQMSPLQFRQSVN